MQSRTLTVREVQAAVRGKTPRATETDEYVFLGYGQIGLFRFQRPGVRAITVSWPEGECVVERYSLNLDSKVMAQLEAKRVFVLACETPDELMSVIWME